LQFSTGLRGGPADLVAERDDGPRARPAPPSLRCVAAPSKEVNRPPTHRRAGLELRARQVKVHLPSKTRGTIQLPQTKNGEGRTVWLNALACQALDSVSRNGARSTDRVFPASEQVSPENVSLAFLRACRKVGVADFRLHDLRHTAASHLRMQGADIHTVAQLLGHKDLRMAARYQHLSPTYLQAAVKGLDTAFGPELASLPAPDEQTEGGAPNSERGADHDVITIEHKNEYELVQAAAS
jgi:hypothetical protein